jgi:hypothetical protein
MMGFQNPVYRWIIKKKNSYNVTGEKGFLQIKQFFTTETDNIAKE